MWGSYYNPSSSLQANFDASELITQRELESNKVSEELTERAKSFGIILDDISLVSAWSAYSGVAKDRCDSLINLSVKIHV